MNTLNRTLAAYGWAALIGFALSYLLLTLIPFVFVNIDTHTLSGILARVVTYAPGLVMAGMIVVRDRGVKTNLWILLCTVFTSVFGLFLHLISSSEEYSGRRAATLRRATAYAVLMMVVPVHDLLKWAYGGYNFLILNHEGFFTAVLYVYYVAIAVVLLSHLKGLGCRKAGTYVLLVLLAVALPHLAMLLVLLMTARGGGEPSHSDMLPAARYAWVVTAFGLAAKCAHLFPIGLVADDKVTAIIAISYIVSALVLIRTVVVLVMLLCDYKALRLRGNVIFYIATFISPLFGICALEMQKDCTEKQ